MKSRSLSPTGSMPQRTTRFSPSFKEINDTLDWKPQKTIQLFLMASFAPEAVFHIGNFPVTNTIINTLLVDAVLVGGALTLKKNIKKVPGYFQSIMEFTFQTFYNLTESIAGKNAKQIFPWFMSFFLFILIANWSGLIPGVTAIGFREKQVTETELTTAEQGKETGSALTGEPVTGEKATSEDNRTPMDKEKTDPENAAKAATGKKESKKQALVPYIRNATSDINVTLALALISLTITHIFAVRAVGIKEYLSRYLSLNPILLFVGVLEVVSEFTKIISLSFRLFGNIYAGEVVLGTIASLFAFLLPIPFMLLEVIVGLVQALVFSMLTMVFMSVLMTPHHAEEHAKEVSH